MEISQEENESKSLRRTILAARKNNDTKAISLAEDKLQSLAANSDDIETHFHLAMLESTKWSTPLKTENIPEKLLFLFEQHPNTVIRLLLEDDLEEGRTARAYLDVIYNNDAFRPIIDDANLLSKVRDYLLKKVSL